ncbi:MAG: FAD-dependent oxidoreductase [Dehalococcoidia bacterium]
MNKEKYRVEVVDASYHRRAISCQNACPVHTDARGYVNGVLNGDYEHAYIIARQPNPLASICGRVCNAPCEGACRRNNIDGPVTIRALKRFLCERFGVEASGHLATDATLGKQRGREILEGPTLSNSNTVESSAARLKALRERAPGTNTGKVAVIGSGPAGLTAANDLAVSGYDVTIFEAAPVPGGMLVLGIPEYRLPRDVIQREIDEILRKKVALKLNMRLGKDFTLSTLQEQGYQAIFITVGAHRSNPVGMEGEDLEGVISGVDFLRNVNLGNSVRIGQRVAVIGGGNVAMDAVRTTMRLGDKDNLGVDVVRTAARLGAKEAFILYRRSREEMPANEEEIEDTEAEGIEIHYLVSPTRIIGKDGRVCAIECVKMELGESDADGRRRPVPIKGSEFRLDVDTVILATGQVSDLSFIQKSDGIEVTREGTIAVDPDTLATTAPGVFAGGDVAFGPRIVIEAVKDGHKASRAIDSYFHKGSDRVICRSVMTKASSGELPPEGGLEIAKQRAPRLPVERRTGVSEVEMVYDEIAAVEQASRCLNCNVQTVFRGELCILCGGCVDVCPRNCYKIVRLDKIEGDQRVNDLIQDGYGIPLEAFQEGGEVLNQGAAMIKDEARCVRCGLCAERCPTGAVTMKAFWFEEELAYDESIVKGPDETRGRKIEVLLEPLDIKQ